MTLINNNRELVEFRISPRRVLQPGMRFRTTRGSGPRVVCNDAPFGVYTTFRCRRIFYGPRGRRRIFCDAVNERTGCLCTLYLAGPPFRSSGIRWCPYRVAICRDQEAHR